jgi:hypothetical protein
MKYLSFVSIALFSMALQAQTASSSGAANAAGTADSSLSRATAQTGTETGAAGRAGSQAGQAAASSAEAANVSAELTKRIDTKNAKVGDEVNAKTTSAAKLSDGTNLPKGTKLLGKVTDVRAKSNDDKTSHLAFALDRAVLRDGREVPVHAVLTSVAGPAMASASTADDMAMSSAGSGMAGGGAPGGVSGAGALGGVSGAGAPAGGGVLGGAGRTVGGVAGGAANTVGSAGRAAGSTAGEALNDTRAAGSLADRAGSLASLDHVPVANLPGVTLSNAGNTTTTGSLDAANKNINLENGTKLTLNVAASQQ